MNWTKEQEDAIYKKDKNILVAAAAGSGKTAVLVERIIEKIVKDNVDIDKLLVVTFTNAAASEMRERILEAIYKKMEEDPENANLQKQLVLLGKANICTIHSFCLDVIRNNFFEIDLSSNFRIGAEEETVLLKQEVLEDLFEELYEEENENFAKLVDTYTGYRGDEPLKEMVLKIYNYIQSMPFPEEWLESQVEKFKQDKSDEDFSKTDWGKILLKEIEDEIIDGINALKVYRNKCEAHFEMEKFTNCLNNDINKLKEFQKSIQTSWDEAYDYFLSLEFNRWPTDKNVVLELKDEAKDARTSIKKKINDTVKGILMYRSEEAFSDIYLMYETLNILKDVVFMFSREYQNKKKERNIIDFNDIEHYALNILVQKNENGEYEPTEVAKKYQNKFEEIAIDEYQDSNQVQEYILTTISKGNNIFMVGDVKQSIYKFRQACPELFLEKYNTYSLNSDEENSNLKIQLFKNFRSRQNVLDVTNTVFENVMSKDLGDIDYTKEEFLNLGAEYEENENIGKAEMHIIDIAEEEEDDIYKDEVNEDSKDSAETDEDNERLSTHEIEAKFVADKIESIIKSKVLINDKKLGNRPVKYKDIVILLRSTAHIAPIYEKELLNRNIPVFTDSTSEYLDTIEIQTIMNTLKILDNPIDDIALVSTLRSQIGGFTDNELVEIRLVDREDSFYNAFMKSKDKLQGKTKEKIDKFLKNIHNWGKKSEYLNVAELIWSIYNDTGFYNYVGLMPNGALRQANLKMLFERAKEYEKTSFKGLYNFIRFIEKLKIGNGDMSSAKIIGENEDVVRIMSIHKSKGLEFPIVFLANTSKKTNLQDLSDNILLHQTIGIGAEYINYDRRIRYSTAAKQAIKIASKRETLSEEMRVLYVALTRAKEKLIITGTVKDAKKDAEKKKDLLNIYNGEKINPILLKKFISFFDWLTLVAYKKDISNLLEITVHKKKDIMKEEVKEEKELRKFDFNKSIDIEKIQSILKFEYKNQIATTLPNKSTVSKVKEMFNENIDFTDLGKKEVGLESVKPKFMIENEKISSSEKGTLMHLFLKKLDFKAEYDLEKLKNLREELVAKKIISLEQANAINLEQILNFLNSNFAKRLKSARQIEKEKPFCTSIAAKDFYENANDETILVQGIIDLYFIDETGKLVLVDYKTDFVENGNEDILIQRYKKQLEIYAKALGEAYSKEVDEVYIYSIYLNKEICVEIAK